MKIPNSVLYVVGDVLGGWYYSHSKLNTLFGGNGFPGDPPPGNCISKIQEWMRRANNAPDVDPLELLGRVLAEFMSLGLHEDSRWEDGLQRITEVLAKNGYTVDLNGNIIPISSESTPEATSTGTWTTPGTQPHVPIAQPLSPPRSTPPMKSTVLFLAANPDGVTKLALDKECRSIREKIRASDFRESLEFKTEWAVRTDDLLQYLNEFRPHVVHFSGHGSPREELILHDQSDQAQPVSLPALRALFTALKDNIRLVVLNACYSRPQAETIVELIDCSIGMKRAIGDKAAIVFAASFYRALGFGRSVKDAFDQGCAALLLEDIPEENTPELLVKIGVNASEVFLGGPSVNPR